MNIKTTLINFIALFIFVLHGLATAGSPSEEINKRGYTASAEGILQATEKQDIDALKLFLAAGISINSINKEKVAPIHVASATGNADIVNYILSNGGNKNALTERNLSPIFIAVRVKSRSVVDALIAAKANPNLPKDLSPLALAINLREIDIARSLIKSGADVNFGTSPPLAFAIGNGDKMSVDLLIENGANPNRVFHLDGVGKTSLLRFAFLKGQRSIAESLLKNKASPNWIDDDGVSEIRFLVRTGSPESLALLGKYNALLNDRHNGLSLLGEAVKDNKIFNTKIIRTLINLGANPRDENIVEPFLMLCGRDCDMNLLSDIVDKGADVKGSDQMIHSRYGTILNLIIENLALEEPATYKLTLSLIRAGADMSTPNQHKALFAFMVVARSKNYPYEGLELIRTMHEAGLDLNQKQPSNDGRLLYIANMNGSDKIIKYLVANGAKR